MSDLEGMDSGAWVEGQDDGVDWEDWVSDEDLLTQPATRLAICMGCDRYRAWTKQCKECGCFMPLKVRFPDKHCPIGKW